MPKTLMPQAAPAGRSVDVGSLLRAWRKERRISQLELALAADSSSRHISFIETGRARPSEAMLLRLADQLNVPVRDRNALFTAAGYAPAYPETPLDAPTMSSLGRTLETILRAHEPHPALIMDATYDVLAGNSAVALLTGPLPDHLNQPRSNALRVTLHPDGMAPRILNFAQWRGHLLDRVERQLALRSSEALRELYEEVAGYPWPKPPRDPAGAAGQEQAADSAAHRYALPLRILSGDRVLSFISTVTTFNTPMDVTVSELAIEAFLPADEETAAILGEGL